ncbi:MAG: hypothetical protein HN348_13525 [Proteobacteria bacterium]|jgi:tetratricopeptide (TPR) repeat protein|nr:hypothetical protein [Pseudomonadota bacterium]
MAVSRIHRWSLAATAALGMLIANTAHALTCDEILNMVRVNVPSNIVIQTMENSGSRFTAADVTCLTDGGAPEDVIAVVRNLANVDAPTPTDPKPTNTKIDEEDEPAGFDRDTMLGGNVEGNGPEPTSGSARIEALIDLYQAKKYQTASKGFYDLLAENAYPDEEAKIQYYLAKSLFDLGLYHSAQHYFMEVVRRGPRNPSFKYALPRLVGIAQKTGNDYELLRIVHKIPPESFPRHAKTQLYYLMGRKLYEKDELSQSAKYFQQVSTKSELYLRAAYFDGVINNERGKLRSAVKSFRDVYQSDIMPTNARSAQEMADLKDMSLINIARIYFGLQRFDNSDNYYALVDRDSRYWPESLFERGWTNFYRNRMNLTLGLLLTVNSPYFNEQEFIPEATILRSLAFFNLCEYDEVERSLLRFEAEYQPMLDELNAFLEQYKSKENRKLSDQAFEEYFTKSHEDSTLRKPLFVRVLRNRDLAALVKHMDLMDKEEETIDQKVAVWRDTIGDELKQTIEADRQRYKKRAGLILLQELLEQRDNLKDLMVQSEIIRFEVVDAQRADYEYRMGTAMVDSTEDAKIDFATSKDVIYWPFNGEFWADELGYYHYTEHSACR